VAFRVASEAGKSDECASVDRSTAQPPGPAPKA
jgi:hypothetical protein